VIKPSFALLNIIIITVCCLCVQVRGEVILRQGDTVSVVLPEKPSHTDRFAAAELTKYFSQLAKVDVRLGESDGAKAVITIMAVNDGSEAARQIAEKAGVAVTDAFAIRIVGNQITLRGGGGRGTLYAAYELLETLGCRWIYPGTDYVPVLPELNLRDRDDIQRPAFVLREIDGDFPSDVDAGQMIDWLAKNRMNRRFNLRPGRVERRYPEVKGIETAWSQRGGELGWQWTAHNLSSMFPVDAQWKASHQHFFALYNGRRVPFGTEGRPGYGGGMVCTTEPEVIEWVARWVNDWFSKNPDALAVPVWPSDGAVKWCECPRCAALGGKNFVNGPEGSMSRRVVTFVNEVARRVAVTHPGKFVVLPAYTNYVDPVPDLAIESNVIVQHVHHGNLGKPVNHPDNAIDAARMQGWAKLAPQRMAIWELGLIGDHFATGKQATIFPLLQRYQQTLSWLHDQGFRYYYSQSVAAYHQSNGLLYWCMGKLMWNPKADLHELVKDYCRVTYGDAGPDVAAFFLALDASAAASTWHPRSYSDVAAPSPAVFTPGFVASGKEMLNRAASLQTLTEIQRARLTQLTDDFLASATAVTMQLETGLDEKQPWRLARGKDAYVMNADGIEIDAKRFDDLVLTLTDQGRFDQSSQRTFFRARKRTEQITTVESDRLRLSVLPGVGGRILRLIDKKTGHNFIQEHPNGSSDTLAHAGDAYFAYGGYEEYVGTGFAGPGWEVPFKSEPLDAAQGTGLTLSAEFELPDGRVRLTRRLELIDRPGEPAALSVRSELTNLESVPRKLSIRSHPLMSVGDDAQTDELYFLTATGVTHSSAKAHHDGPTIQPQGAWATVSSTGGRGMVHQFDPKTAKAYFFCEPGGRYFAMELFGQPLEVDAGKSVVLEQRFTPIADRVAMAVVMAQAFGDDVPMPPSTQPIDRLIKAGGVSPVIRDGAAVFDGKAYLTYADPTMKIDPAQGTISFWVKPSGEKIAAAQFLISAAQNAGDWMYVVLESPVVETASPRLSMLMSRGTKPFDKPGQFYARISAELSKPKRDDGWLLVTIRWDAAKPGQSSLEIFCDDAKIHSVDNLTFQTPPIAGPLFIGSNGGSPTGRFVGEMSGIAFSSKKHAEADIANRFDRGRTQRSEAAGDKVHIPLSQVTDAVFEAMR